MLKEIKKQVEQRLERKLKKAESAFVREKTSTKAENCFYGGRLLTGNIRNCKLKCQGASEFCALQCWDEKARDCNSFRLKIPAEKIREQFRSFLKEEVSIRWPSIGELSWVLEQIKLLELKETK
jgi:hypothetical protein